MQGHLVITWQISMYKATYRVFQPSYVVKPLTQAGNACRNWEDSTKITKLEEVWLDVYGVMMEYVTQTWIVIFLCIVGKCRLYRHQSHGSACKFRKFPGDWPFIQSSDRTSLKENNSSPLLDLKGKCLSKRRRKMLLNMGHMLEES